MILLELNEFNAELLGKAARELDLKNLQRLCTFKKTETEADEKLERFGLDPWVQWPSIHTGKPVAEHGLKHLADAYKLEHRQLWDVLAANNIACGIWGPMNAKLFANDNIKFYFPDPWTYTETANPKQLNRLLALPRYYAQHYLALEKGKTVLSFFKTLSFFLSPKLFFSAISYLPFILRKSWGETPNNPLLFSIFDLVNAIGFNHYCRKEQVDFKLIFLNSVAHCQHHCWTEKESLSPEMKILFRFLDESVGLIFNLAEDGEPIIICNAFSQYCSIERREFLFRQIDPAKFFESLGIDADCEQLMTNDSQLLFADRSEAARALDTLQEITVLGKELFQVSHDPEDERRLFCQVLIWDDVPQGTEFRNGPRSIDFYQHFEKVVQRSGSHLSKGDVFSNIVELPDKMTNYRLFDHILNYYGVNR